MPTHDASPETLIVMRQDQARVGELIARTGMTVGMFHGELAKVFGVSRRTVSRWAREGTVLRIDHVTALAELALTRDRELAAEIAALAESTLVGLGLEEAPPMPATKRIDAVVCAAAEALDVSPRAVRPALLAAVRCAREVGLTLEAMETMLGAKRATKT